MPVLAPAQSIAGVLDGLLSALTTLFTTQTGVDGAPVLVSFGPPGQYQPGSIVAIMDTRCQITRPTMGPARSRQMDADVDVLISVYSPGDESAQQVCTDAAFVLLGLLEAYLRTSPNERLAGASWDGLVSAAAVAATVAYDPASNNPMGRVTEITTTVTAKIRY